MSDARLLLQPDVFWRLVLAGVVLAFVLRQLYCLALYRWHCRRVRRERDEAAAVVLPGPWLRDVSDDHPTTSSLSDDLAPKLVHHQPSTPNHHRKGPYAIH